MTVSDIKAFNESVFQLIDIQEQAKKIGLKFLPVFMLLIAIMAVVNSEANTNIDDDDFCRIRFYKVKHFDDPTPYSYEGKGRRRAYLKEKSIKVFGKCCWRVYTYKNYCNNNRKCIKNRSKLLTGNTHYPDNTSWGLPQKKITSFRKVKC